MIITLTTDIGWEYAAEMKGKIYSINPDAKIVDVTHEIKPQRIVEGAFIIYSISPYFKNAIHVGVVDPGVGTERRPIIIDCGNCYFVGPDNGLLIPSAKRMGIKNIYEIIINERVSSVFHGRDVFAPAAARLSKGEDAGKLGRKVDEYVDFDFGEPLEEGNKIKGKILFIDRFGNIITNIKLEEEKFVVKIGKIEREVKLYPSYGYAKVGEVIAVCSSSGFLEIAINQGNAGKYFNAREGGEIEIFL
ncbi:MAG: SAM-dependent chlorinase/fluorinase [Thermoplasmatales archaeon]|nr:SAM-dependent chlorinase/fluorinase [Thermoplasmatales archaeon]